MANELSMKKALARSQPPGIIDSDCEPWDVGLDHESEMVENDHIVEESVSIPQTAPIETPSENVQLSPDALMQKRGVLEHSETTGDAASRRFAWRDKSVPNNGVIIGSVGLEELEPGPLMIKSNTPKEMKRTNEKTLEITAMRDQKEKQLEFELDCCEPGPLLLSSAKVAKLPLEDEATAHETDIRETNSHEENSEKILLRERDMGDGELEPGLLESAQLSPDETDLEPHTIEMKASDEVENNMRNYLPMRETESDLDELEPGPLSETTPDSKTFAGTEKSNLEAFLGDDSTLTMGTKAKPKIELELEDEMIVDQSLTSKNDKNAEADTFTPDPPATTEFHNNDQLSTSLQQKSPPTPSSCSFDENQEGFRIRDSCSRSQDENQITHSTGPWKGSDPYDDNLKSSNPEQEIVLDDRQITDVHLPLETGSFDDEINAEADSDVSRSMALTEYSESTLLALETKLMDEMKMSRETGNDSACDMETDSDSLSASPRADSASINSDCGLHTEVSSPSLVSDAVLNDGDELPASRSIASNPAIVESSETALQALVEDAKEEFRALITAQSSATDIEVSRDIQSDLVPVPADPEGGQKDEASPSSVLDSGYQENWWECNTNGSSSTLSEPLSPLMIEKDDEASDHSESLNPSDVCAASKPCPLPETPFTSTGERVGSCRNGPTPAPLSHQFSFDEWAVSSSLTVGSELCESTRSSTARTQRSLIGEGSLESKNRRRFGLPRHTRRLRRLPLRRIEIEKSPTLPPIETLAAQTPNPDGESYRTPSNQRFKKSKSMPELSARWWSVPRDERAQNCVGAAERGTAQQNGLSGVSSDSIPEANHHAEVAAFVRRKSFGDVSSFRSYSLSIEDASFSTPANFDQKLEDDDGWSSVRASAQEDYSLEKALCQLSSIAVPNPSGHSMVYSNVARLVAWTKWQQIFTRYRHDALMACFLSGVSSRIIRRAESLDDSTLASSSEKDGGKHISKKAPGFVAPLLGLDSSSWDRYHGTHGDALTGFLCQIKPIKGEHLCHDRSNCVEHLMDKAQKSQALLLSLLSYLKRRVQARVPDSNTIATMVCSKEVTRVHQKADRKYGGDIYQVKDILRSQMIFQSEAELVTALVELWKGSLHRFSRRGVRGIRVARLKNLFSDSYLKLETGAPLPTGYRHVLLNVILENGMMAEIQLHLKQMYEVLGTEGPILHKSLNDLGKILDLPIYSTKSPAKVLSSWIKEANAAEAIDLANPLVNAPVTCQDLQPPMMNQMTPLRSNTGKVVPSKRIAPDDTLLLPDLSTKSHRLSSEAKNSLVVNTNTEMISDVSTHTKEDDQVEELTPSKLMLNGCDLNQIESSWSSKDRGLFVQSLVSIATSSIAESPRDLQLISCVVDFVGSILLWISFDDTFDIEPADLQHWRLYLSSLLSVALKLADQATSTGMTGWLQYGISSTPDRAPHKFYSTLRTLASLASVDARLQGTLVVLEDLVTSANHHLSSCHPTSLCSFLDMAIIYERNNRWLEAFRLVSDVSSRIDRFLLHVRRDCFRDEASYSTGTLPTCVDFYIHIPDTGSPRTALSTMIRDFAHELKSHPVPQSESYSSVIPRLILADSLLVLGTIEKVQSDLNAREPRNNTYQRTFQLAGVHYRKAMKFAINVCGPFSAEVFATACGLSSCLWNCGDREAAKRLLSSLVRKRLKGEVLHCSGGMVDKTKDNPLSSQRSHQSACRTLFARVQCCWQLAMMILESPLRTRDAIELLRSASKDLRRALPTLSTKDRHACSRLIQKIDAAAKHVFASF